MEMAALAEAEVVPQSSHTWSFWELCDVLVWTCLCAAACRGFNIAVSASFLVHGDDHEETYRALFLASFLISILALLLFVAVCRLLQLFRDHIIHTQCLGFGFGFAFVYETVLFAYVRITSSRATRYLSIASTIEVIFYLTLVREAWLAKARDTQNPDTYSLFAGRIQKLSCVELVVEMPI